MTHSSEKYTCIREKQLSNHEAEIAALKERSYYKEEKLNELNRNMEKMDNKLDEIVSSVEELKLQSAKDDFNIDNRVKALESKIETLKWVTGSAIAILSVIIALLSLIMTSLH